MAVVVIMEAAKRLQEENQQIQANLMVDNCHWCREQLSLNQYLVGQNGRPYKTCGICFRSMLRDFGNPRKCKSYGTTLYWWTNPRKKSVTVPKTLSLEDEWQASTVTL